MKRTHSRRKQAKLTQQEQAAKHLQRLARGYKARVSVKQQKQAVVEVQRVIRGKLARKMSAQLRAESPTHQGAGKKRSSRSPSGGGSRERRRRSSKHSRVSRGDDDARSAATATSARTPTSSKKGKKKAKHKSPKDSENGRASGGLDPVRSGACCARCWTLAGNVGSTRPLTRRGAPRVRMPNRSRKRCWSVSRTATSRRCSC